MLNKLEQKVMFELWRSRPVMCRNEACNIEGLLDEIDLKRVSALTVSPLQRLKPLASSYNTHTYTQTKHRHMLTHGQFLSLHKIHYYLVSINKERVGEREWVRPPLQCSIIDFPPKRNSWTSLLKGLLTDKANTFHAKPFLPKPRSHFITSETMLSMEQHLMATRQTVPSHQHSMQLFEKKATVLTDRKTAYFHTLSHHLLSFSCKSHRLRTHELFVATEFETFPFDLRGTLMVHQSSKRSTALMTDWQCVLDSAG